MSLVVFRNREDVAVQGSGSEDVDPVEWPVRVLAAGRDQQPQPLLEVVLGKWKARSENVRKNTPLRLGPISLDLLC